MTSVRLLSLSQTPEWARALRAAGLAVSEWRGAGWCVVTERRLPGLGRVQLASGGPVLVPGQGVDSYLRGRRGVQLLSPEDIPAAELRAAGALPIFTPGWRAEWGLTGDLRAGLHPKWRNGLRRAERAALTVRSGDLPADPDHWLLRAEAAQGRARRYRPVPPAILAAWAQANPGTATVWQAQAGGASVAALLVLRHGATATYQIGWTAPEGRACNAHNLLLWRVVRRLQDQGVARFDLGLLDDVHSPGLTRFKLRTGAQARRLSGTWLWHQALASVLRRRRQLPSIHVPSGQKA